MADCVDLSFTWNLCIDNLEFEWSGYSDSLPLYVEATLNLINQMRLENLEKIFG